MLSKLFRFESNAIDNSAHSPAEGLVTQGFVAANVSIWNSDPLPILQESHPDALLLTLQLKNNILMLNKASKFSILVHFTYI